MAELPTVGGMPKPLANGDHEMGGDSMREQAKYSYEAPEFGDQGGHGSGGHPFGGFLPMMGNCGGGCGSGMWGGPLIGGLIGGAIGGWIGGERGDRRGHGHDCGCGEGRGVGLLDVKEEVRHEGETARQFGLQRDYFAGTGALTAQNFGLQKDILLGDFALQKDILLSGKAGEIEGMKNTFALLQTMNVNARDAERCCCEMQKLLIRDKGDLALQLCQQFGLTREQAKDCCCTLQKEIESVRCQQIQAEIRTDARFKEGQLLDENRHLRGVIDMDKRFCHVEKQLGSIYSAIQAQGVATRNQVVKLGVDNAIGAILNNAALPTALAPAVAQLTGLVNAIVTNPVQAELPTAVAV